MCVCKSTSTICPNTPATLDPTTATFDKYASSEGYKDVTTSLTGGDLEGVYNGSTPLGDTDYSYSNGTITVKKEYLATLETGDVTLTVKTDDGNATLTVTISDTTPEQTEPEEQTTP